MSEVTCPTCQMLIGITKEYNGIELLLLGDKPTRLWHGFCPKCGKAIYWKAGDKALEKLIQKASNPLIS